MHIWQAIKMAMKSLWTNKLRSFLTMLGIIIGVMTVSLLTTVAQGVSNAVVSSIREQSTLAVLMNMTQRMTYSEADSIIKEVQPDDINAEDYFDYSLVLNSSSATTYQSIDGVSEDYENYLLYEKLYDFSPEELKKLEPQEQLVATALMSKRKRAPTETSIMVVPANFTTVYKLDIDGNFPKENNEVLVDRKFVKYYFKNEDYLGAIGKTISFGVTYKTQIKIKLTNPLNQNEDIYEKICNFLVGKFGTGKFINTKTGKPVSKKAEPAVSGIEEFVDAETGEPVDSKNVEEICIGANLKILKNVDGKDYAFDEENQTLVIDTEFTESYKDLIDKNSPEIPTTGDETSFVQDLMKIDSIQGLILYSSLFTGATEITKDDVSVAEIYSSENAKTFTVCGVLTDKNESLFVGTASIGETSDKDDGTEKLDLAALMGAMQSTRGTAYVLQSDETLKSVGINAKRVSDATIFYAYFRYKTEDVVDDSVSKISIAFLQSRYMIMSDFMMISMVALES